MGGRGGVPYTLVEPFFLMLGQENKASSQESKSSIGLGTHISDMSVPFQITSNCCTEVFDAFNIFKNCTF